MIDSRLPIGEDLAEWGLMLRKEDLMIIAASPGLAKAMGCKPEDLIGKDLGSLALPESREILDRTSELGSTLSSFSGSLVLKKAGDQEVCFEVSFGQMQFEAESYVTLTLLDAGRAAAQELEQKRLEAILDSTNNAIVGKTLQGIVTHWNKGAERMFGYTADEMIGASIQRIIPPDRLDEEELIISRCAGGKTVNIWETRRRKKNGEFVEVSLTCTPVFGRSGRVIGITKIAQDVAIQTRQQKELARMSRLYSALSQVNQSIVWSTMKEELFTRVCRVLVDYGGLESAWIGWHNPENSMLEPVAAHGDQNDYFKNSRIYVDDRPEAKTPISRAFREERPVVCNDFWRDAATAPWHGEARRRGIRSCAVFPIRLNGKVEGTLQVYANETDFFQDKEVALLTEAAADVSFALDTFAIQQAHLEAERLAEEERIFSGTIIESMPGVVYYYDSELNFLRWNKNFEEVTGYSSDEIVKMTPLDFFADEDKPALHERIKEVFEKGESWIESRFLSKDGTFRDFHFTGRRIEYQGKSGLIGMGVDISSRVSAIRALQDSEHRFRTTLESILEACQLLDFEWRYTFLNEAAETQNRRPNSDLLGKTIYEVWPGVEGTHIFSLLKRAMDERISSHEETVFTFPDGSTGVFEVMVQPVPEGVFLLSIDIGARKAAERALIDINEQLEAKVAERTEELRNALHQAESADKIKSAFLATMSHELRTPLNSILGFTGILLQELPGTLNIEQKNQLSMVKSSAKHLLDLITDILDISKIEAGQLEVRQEVYSLKDSLNKVCQTIQPQVKRKGLAFSTEFPDSLPDMIGDSRRVEQVLLNLLSNAVKFCEVGSVAISAELLDRHDFPHFLASRSAVRIDVRDTGIGISKEDIDSLFLPFKQLDTGLTRQHEGSGLGLAICKRLVSLMKGEIKVESELGIGSTFSVYFPVV